MTYSSAMIYMNRDFYFIMARFAYLTTNDKTTVLGLI